MIRSRAVARPPRHQPIASTHQVAPAAAYGAMCPAAVPGSVAPSTAMSKGRLPASSAHKAHCVGERLHRHRRVPLVREGEEYAVEAGGLAMPDKYKAMVLVGALRWSALG